MENTSISITRECLADNRDTELSKYLILFMPHLLIIFYITGVAVIARSAFTQTLSPPPLAEGLHCPPVITAGRVTH